MGFSLSYDTAINYNLHISISSYHYHQRFNNSTVIYLRSWKFRWPFRVNEYIISIPIEAYHDPKYKDHVNVSNCILINHVVSCPDKLLNTIRKSLFLNQLRNTKWWWNSLVYVRHDINALRRGWQRGSRRIRSHVSRVVSSNWLHARSNASTYHVLYRRNIFTLYQSLGHIGIRKSEQEKT